MHYLFSRVVKQSKNTHKNDAEARMWLSWVTSFALRWFVRSTTSRPLKIFKFSALLGLHSGEPDVKLIRRTDHPSVWPWCCSKNERKKTKQNYNLSIIGMCSFSLLQQHCQAHSNFNAILQQTNPEKRYLFIGIIWTKENPIPAWLHKLEQLLFSSICKWDPLYFIHFTHSSLSSAYF